MENTASLLILVSRVRARHRQRHSKGRQRQDVAPRAHRRLQRADLGACGFSGAVARQRLALADSLSAGSRRLSVRTDQILRAVGYDDRGVSRLRCGIAPAMLAAAGAVALFHEPISPSVVVGILTIALVVMCIGVERHKLAAQRLALGTADGQLHCRLHSHRCAGRARSAHRPELHRLDLRPAGRRDRDVFRGLARTRVLYYGSGAVAGRPRASRAPCRSLPMDSHCSPIAWAQPRALRHCARLPSYSAAPSP